MMDDCVHSQAAGAPFASHLRHEVCDDASASLYMCQGLAAAAARKERDAMCTVLHPAAAQQRRVPSGVLLCSPGCTSASAGEQQRAAEMAAVRAVQATSIRGTDPAAGVAHSDDEAAVQDGALAAAVAGAGGMEEVLGHGGGAAPQAARSLLPTTGIMSLFLARAAGPAAEQLREPPDHVEGAQRPADTTYSPPSGVAAGLLESLAAALHPGNLIRTAHAVGGASAGTYSRLPELCMC
jgi:hypothetical protein